MKIILEPTKYHRFAFYCDYTKERIDFCRSVKDAYGWNKFSFDAKGSLKRWVFSDTEIVTALTTRFPSITLDPAVEQIVMDEHLERDKKERQDKQIDKVKEKTDTEFTVKGLKKDLYPYQKVGVEFLVASGGRAIIADAPGLGKTAQALGFAKYNKFDRILVVSPASVKFSWENETKKWTNFTPFVIDSKTDISKIPADANVWIINYDILKKHYDELSKIRFDSIIGDEAQLIKNTSAIRTKVFKKLSRNIPSVVLLSGTPLLSRPSELFSLLNIIDPKTWDNWYVFARRYCGWKETRWGVDTSGATNTSELHDRIRRYFIRRDKTEVLKELPPKNFIDVPLQLGATAKKEYNTAARDLATYLRTYSGKQTPEIVRAMNAEKLTQLNVLRYLNAEGKIPTTIELADSIVSAGEKMLIFCSFIDPLEKLKEYFGDQAVILTGESTMEERKDAVERFQNDPNIKVFLGGIRSAGVGITLTAASNVIFMDYSWNPADHQQAQDRIHRPGQKANSVNIYQLQAIGTIDEDLKSTLEKKQGIFDEVIEGKVSSETATEAMDAAVDRVLNNY